MCFTFFSFKKKKFTRFVKLNKTLVQTNNYKIIEIKLNGRPYVRRTLIEILNFQYF